MTAHPKSKTDKDQDFLEAIKELQCLACGTHPPNDAHHIKTRGSGGGDDHWNLMPLCRNCHTVIHKMGLTQFIGNFPHVEQFLIDLGWEWQGYKLFHP
jgi:5-methylcytosine-specific restriction endonuclease McrA